MKLKTIYNISLGVLLAGLTSCTGMDDSYKEYLDWGERIYGGKMDSVLVRAGRLRQQLDFYYTSPRIVRGVVYWNKQQDSLEFEVPQDVNKFSKVLTSLSEGEVSYKIYTYDKYGNSSQALECAGRVYGPIYESVLLTADIEKVENRETQFYMKWKNISEMEGVNLTYTDKTGEDQTLFVPSSVAECVVDAEPGSKYSYTTIHRPEVTAIDSLVSEAVTGNYPYYQAKIQVYNCPGNSGTAWGWDPWNLYDGSIDEPGWHTGGDSGPWPHRMSFELAQPTKLYGFKIFQRSGGDWAYRAGNPKHYTLLGRNEPVVDDSDDGWVVLGTFQSVKPSGLPVGQLTNEDINYARAGEYYTIENHTAYRYLQIRVNETWGNEQATHFTELQFFGLPAE